MASDANSAECLLDKSWQDYSNCFGVDPDAFFPEHGANTEEARGVCRGCTVREDCLEYAMEREPEPVGIWGGLDEHERKQLRRQRRIPQGGLAMRSESRR